MAFTSASQQPLQNLPRTRRSHAKVKTGCITCKIRKKKCDETRPACLRCSSTGRKCDGYTVCSTDDASLPKAGLASTPLDELSASLPMKETRPLKRLRIDDDRSSAFYRCSGTVGRSPSLFFFEIPIEGQCFDFFRCETGPQFASYFDSSMWRSFVVKAAMQHPAILQAVAAVGAAHRRFSFGISREAFEYCAVADKLHRKALQSLRELQSSDGTHSREIKMMAYVLLGLYEGFSGNYDKTVQHLVIGLRHVLDRPFRIVQSESQYCSVKMTPEAFNSLFDRLKHRAVELLQCQINYFCYYGSELELLSVPRQFTSIEHARDVLFTDVEWILQIPAESWQDLTKCSKLQSKHVSRLLKWSVAYAETMRANPNRSETELKVCKLLKITRNAAYLFLYVILSIHVKESSHLLPEIDLFSQSEDKRMKLSNTIEDDLWQTEETNNDLDTNLARLSVLGESVFNDNSAFAYREHSMSFDSGIGPPRLPDPDPGKSSTKTRHLVKSLIANNSDVQTDLWEHLGIYGIAERLSAIEEHALIEALKGHLIPEHHRPKWVDVTFFLESRKLLLQYCRPDDHGLGTIWERQWMVFGPTAKSANEADNNEAFTASLSSSKYCQHSSYVD